MTVRRRETSTPAPSLPRLQQRRALDPRQTDQYRGYLPDGDSQAVAVEAIGELDREKLWQDYISCRKPVVIDGLIEEANWDGKRWTDLKYLREVAGNALVKIEPVDSTRDQFGTAAKRKTVTLATFLDMLQNSQLAGKWYMTTQYEEEEDDDDDDEDDGDEEEGVEVSRGRQRDSPEEASAAEAQNSTQKMAHQDETQVDEPTLPKLDFDVSLPAPTDSLAHLFPLPGPSIMGNLVLQQCNLWLGNGRSGKSSGLHHDFHDNLYMLLSGRKRFLIWPPLAHRWLEPVGKIDTVHPNGLIEYEAPGQPSLQADGLTRMESMKWLFRARLRALWEADERAAQQNGDGHVARKLRKGKGKQTSEQEAAGLRLREAEVELLLLQVEEEDESSSSELLSDVSEDFVSDIALSEEGLSSSSSSSSSSNSSVNDDSSLDDDDSSFPAADDAILQICSSEGEKMSKKAYANGNGKREYSEDTESEEDDEVFEPHTKKKKARQTDKLVIPHGGLPGGLRGSLEDPEGDFDSGSDEYADEDAEAGALYLGGDFEEEGDEDEQGTELMTLEMRAAVLARMRAMAEGQMFTEDLQEESGDEEEETERDEEEDASEPNVIRRISTERVGGGTDTDEEAPGSEDSWPSIDENALDEGEAALEELARMQELQEGGASTGTAKARIGDDDPKSFSKISPKIMQWYFRKPFDPAANEEPQLQAESDERKVYLMPRHGCPEPIEIHLKAGQMLYLPASWYHEVTSYSDPEEESGVHMALNYWFHPPTAIRRPDQAPVQVRGGSTAKRAYRDSSQPYLNAEAWEEIRRCVNRKVDIVRQKAAQQAEKTKKKQTNTTTM